MRKDLFNKQVAQYSTPEVENREELYIDENIRSIIPSMKISGETYQKTYNGYNLLELSDTTKTVTDSDGNELVAEVKDGVVVINGKSNVFTTITLTVLAGGLVGHELPAGTYTYTTHYLVRDTTLNTGCDWYFQDLVENTRIYGYTGTTPAVKTFSNNILPNQVSFYISPDKEYVNFRFVPAVIKGSHTTLASLPPYEPYVGGKASPNTDFPQEIIIAGDVPGRIRVASDNLFDINGEPFYAVDNTFNMGYLPKIENGIIYGGGRYGSSDGAYLCVKVDGKSRYHVSYEIEIEDPTNNTVNVRRAGLFSDVAADGKAAKSTLFNRVSGLKNGAVDSFTVDTYGYEYLGVTWFTNNKYAFKVKNLTITKCKNYFDITKVTGANRVDRLPAVGGADFGTVENNILQLKYGAYSLGTAWTGANIKIDHSGYYHVSLDIYVPSTISKLNYVPRTRLYNATKQTSTGWKIAGSNPPFDTWTHMTIIDISVPSGWENDEVFLGLQILGGATQYKELPVYAKNVAVYGPVRKEYEPGYGSNEVEIPTEIELNGKTIPLRFARLEKRDIEDELIIDSAQQKVKYIQRLGYYEPIAADRLFIYTTNKHICFYGALDKAYNRAYGLSTHNSIVGGWSTAVNALWIGAGGNRNIVWYGALTALGIGDWADGETPTAEQQASALAQFNEWLTGERDAGRPVRFIYELLAPIEYDLTDTDLGQKLLGIATYNGTNIISLTNGNELKQKLKIKYLKHV